MNQSNLLTVRVAGVMNRQAVVLHAGRTLPCLLSGRLLRQKDSLAVGDRAEAEVLGGGQYRLTRILPRTSALRRPSRRGSGDALLAANADFVLAVCAAPALLRAFTLPEWALEAARAAGLPAGLFVSHWDRLAPEEGEALARRLEPLRAELDGLAWGSALEPPAGLLHALRGKAVAVLGGPGCGKTALIQRLAGVQAPPPPHHCRLSLPGAGRHPLAGHPRFPGRVPRRQARPGLPPPALRGVLLLQGLRRAGHPRGGRQPAPQPLPPLSVQPPRGRGARRPGLYLPGDYGAGGRVGAQGGGVGAHPPLPRLRGPPLQPDRGG